MLKQIKWNEIEDLLLKVIDLRKILRMPIKYYFNDETAGGAHIRPKAKWVSEGENPPDTFHWFRKSIKHENSFTN